MSSLPLPLSVVHRSQTARPTLTSEQCFNGSLGFQAPPQGPLSLRARGNRVYIIPLRFNKLSPQVWESDQSSIITVKAENAETRQHFNLDNKVDEQHVVPIVAGQALWCLNYANRCGGERCRGSLVQLEQRQALTCFGALCAIVLASGGEPRRLNVRLTVWPQQWSALSRSAA